MKNIAKISSLLLFITILLISSCNKDDNDDDNNTPPPPQPFKLTSTAFDSAGIIPIKYTCNGEDISPPLSWSNPPNGTASFVLVVSDPDAPSGTFIHWIVFNIPPATISIKEKASQNATLPGTSLEGTHSNNFTNYMGPCPPSSTHRYYFTLSALDIVLSLSSGVKIDQLNTAMNNHILEQVQLMGKYSQ